MTKTTDGADGTAEGTQETEAQGERGVRLLPRSTTEQCWRAPAHGKCHPDEPKCFCRVMFPQQKDFQ